MENLSSVAASGPVTSIVNAWILYRPPFRSAIALFHIYRRWPDTFGQPFAAILAFFDLRVVSRVLKGAY
jgi:hypothetical protein